MCCGSSTFEASPKSSLILDPGVPAGREKSRGRTSVAIATGRIGPDQDRTDDLLNAIEALYQLSYEPLSNREGEENQLSAPRGKVFVAGLGFGASGHQFPVGLFWLQKGRFVGRGRRMGDVLKHLLPMGPSRLVPLHRAIFCVACA